MLFALIIVDSTLAMGGGLGVVAGLILAVGVRRYFQAFCGRSIAVLRMQQDVVIALWLIWCGVMMELFTRTSSALLGHLTQSESVLVGALTAFLFYFCVTIKAHE